MNCVLGSAIIGFVAGVETSPFHPASVSSLVRMKKITPASQGCEELLMVCVRKHLVQLLLALRGVLPILFTGVLSFIPSPGESLWRKNPGHLGLRLNQVRQQWLDLSRLHVTCRNKQ